MPVVDKWETPTLVIHGGRDYRIPVTEGLSTFTALQRKGIPSKLLHFPLENHWCVSSACVQPFHAVCVSRVLNSANSIMLVHSLSARFVLSFVWMAGGTTLC